MRAFAGLHLPKKKFEGTHPSGIGRANALGFAREGASLAVIDINGEAVDKTAADIRTEGGKARSFVLDATDRAACRPVADEVAGTLGRVSTLVNNAGITRRKAFTADGG